MPITFTIDREARLVRATVRGDVSADDMLACVVDAARVAGTPGFHVLSDHREIGEPATRGQLEQLVDRLVLLREHYAGARWAVIVAHPASYGMMRMLGVLAEQVPMTVRVFVDAGRAERWARGLADADEADDPPPP